MQVGVGVLGGDGVQDAPADAAELFDLRTGQRGEHKPTHQFDVAGSSAHRLPVPLVGERGKGVTAVSRVGVTADVALAFQTGHDLGQTGERTLGERGEGAHAQFPL